MIAIRLLLSAVEIVINLVDYVVVMLSGGTAHRVSGADADHARVLADLGEVTHRFTNVSPWRARFAVAALAASAALGYAEWATREPGYRLAAYFAGGAGLLSVLYVATHTPSVLHLHTRGLAVAVGSRHARAVYYPDIATVGYDIAIVANISAQSQQEITKGLMIDLHDGGRYEIGTDFVDFWDIKEAVLDHATACAATQELAGRYRVTGRQLNAGTPEEVEVTARSPRHARSEALEVYGVLAEQCERVGPIPPV